MSYDSNEQLPDSVRGSLPEHGQEIYRKAFNNALDEYDDEQRAHQTAWAAVRSKYKKVEQGEWKRK